MRQVPAQGCEFEQLVGFAGRVVISFIAGVWGTGDELGSGLRGQSPDVDEPGVKVRQSAPRGDEDPARGAAQSGRCLLPALEPAPR
ncbi:hypothetical protein [Streptomyces sp. Ag109_O5-1]|uniref:hypothetical protein n=1 Tax=Streptomyces sp. Ag109_O5-1 TaxID=1938851 RepID=UPI001623A671|nr:hypothetical protein [Streptomyces sp. Ag109_O5-1]